MSSVTFKTLMDDLAYQAGMNPNPTAGTDGNPTEVDKSNFVFELNRAIRWVWGTDDPLFAWPVAVTSSNNITVSKAATQAAIVAAGTGYSAGDTLTVVGGTGTAATIKVLTVSTGAITNMYVLTGGIYSVFPTSPVSVTGGGGTGATFNLSSKSFVAASAVSNADWASFWPSDPTVYPSPTRNSLGFFQYQVEPVLTQWDGVQFVLRTDTSTTPIFAFYRTAAPQGTWAAGGAYATPTVPAEFEDMITSKALAGWKRKFRPVDASYADDERNAVSWMEGRKAALMDGSNCLAWGNNVVVV